MNNLNIPPCSICGRFHPGYCCVTSLSSFVSQSDIKTIRAAAYRAGRIAQAEEDAQLLERRAPETSGPDYGTDDGYTRGEKRDMERICYAHAAAIRANIAKLKDEEPK